MNQLSMIFVCLLLAFLTVLTMLDGVAGWGMPMDMKTWFVFIGLVATLTYSKVTPRN
jgi:hypothetical protein